MGLLPPLFLTGSCAPGNTTIRVSCKLLLPMAGRSADTGYTT